MVVSFVQIKCLFNTAHLENARSTHLFRFNDNSNIKKNSLPLSARSLLFHLRPLRNHLAYTTNRSDNTSCTNDIRKCGDFFYAIGKKIERFSNDLMYYTHTNILCLFIYRFICEKLPPFGSSDSFLYVVRARSRERTCMKIGTKLIWSRWNVLHCTHVSGVYQRHRKCFQRNRTT